jgi:hypothetical protein
MHTQPKDIERLSVRWISQRFPNVIGIRKWNLTSPQFFLYWRGEQAMVVTSHQDQHFFRLNASIRNQVIDQTSNTPRL